MLVSVLVPGAADMGHVCCWRGDDGIELPVLPLLPCQAWGMSPFVKEPGATLLPRQDAVGIWCASLQPCLCVCVPDAHIYGAKHTCGCICVYVYSDVYTECVCVGVCVCELFKSKTCTKTIWLNLSLGSEA